MKNLLVIALLFYYSYATAQSSTIIKVNPKKKVYLFFKSPIVKGVSIPNKSLFTFNSESGASIGIVTGEKNTDSNLLITTKDGLTYSFSLMYSKSLSKLNYFIEKDIATNYTSDFAKNNASTKKDMNFDKNGMIVLGNTPKKQVEIAVNTDNEALKVARLEKEKLEAQIRKEKDDEQAKLAHLQKIEKEKAKEEKAMLLAKKRDAKALRDIKRKKERALSQRKRKEAKAIAATEKAKEKALKAEKKAKRKKDAALKKLADKKADIAKNETNKRAKVVSKKAVEKKEVVVENEIPKIEAVKEDIVEKGNVEIKKEKVTQNDVNKQVNSFKDITLGYADKGFGLHASYNKFLKKAYYKIGLDASFSKIKNGSYKIPVNVYNVNLGYYYPLLHKTNFNWAIGAGGLLGFETVNGGDDVVDDKIIKAENNFIYGAYIGTEVGFRVSDHIGLVGKINQNFYLNSDVGSQAPYFGFGIRLLN